MQWGLTRVGLASDIQNGRHVSGLPEALSQSMTASLQLGVELDLDIESDVEPVSFLLSL
jgi:hypothetical protein